MTTSTRYYGFDLLRLVSMFAIYEYHCFESIFYVDDPFWLTTDRSIFLFLHVPSRYLTFSGFTIVGLSAFLYGLKRVGSGRIKILAVVLVLGAVLLWVAFGDYAYKQLNLEWDVYHYLIVSALTVYVIRNHLKVVYALAAVGFVLLWIPFWEFEALNALPKGLQQAVVGECRPDGGGMFPLLPWIGLVWSFYGLGRWVQGITPARLERWYRGEIWAWLALLLLCAPWFGVYYDMKTGPGFGCDTHRHPPYEFWANIVYVLFAMRISMLARVNDRLTRFRIVPWLSSLMWNRQFGICYLLHVFLLSIAAIWSQVFWDNYRLFDLLLITLPVVTELLVRFGARLLSKPTAPAAA